MKKLLLIGLLAMLSISVTALNEDFSDIKALMNSFFDSNGILNAKGIQQMAYANTYAEEIPEIIRDIFGNEKMNLEISFNDGSKEIFGIITEEAKIVTIRKHEIENPTMKVKTSDQTINEILLQQNRIKAFINAYNSGKISYETEEIGIVPAAKKTFIDVIISIFGWFINTTGQVLLPQA